MLNRSTLFCLLLTASTSIVLRAAEVNGRWRTQDGQSIIQISTDATGHLQGRIVQGPQPDEKDLKNPKPELRQRSLLGLVILRDFVPSSPLKWKDGHIYDPDSGNDYKALLWFTEGEPNRLRVKGYVGISLLGRTEVWNRESGSK
jgi:uncharacterized protein (DUF2147 family)